FDAASLLRQLGVPSPPSPIPGRAGFNASLSGPMSAGRRWALAFEGGGVNLEGTGRITGAMEAPAIDGRLALHIDDLKRAGDMLGVPFEGVGMGEPVQIESGFRARGGRLVMDDLT